MPGLLADVTGLVPNLAHQLVITTLQGAADLSSRLAVVVAHPPDLTKSATGIGGAVNLCSTCSPGTSRVGWPCTPYRQATGGLIGGIPEVS